MDDVIDRMELATRVAALIDRHDKGDLARAARRIGARAADLRDIVDGTGESPSLSALCAIVRGYDVDAWWLISGETGWSVDLPTERRVQTLNLLSELGATMTMQRRLWHSGRVTSQPSDDSATRA